MTITGDKVIFETTGRLIDTREIIGLYQVIKLFGGYDKELDAFHENWMKDLEGNDYSAFNQQERFELAEFMIARWQGFRKRAEAEKIA